MSRPERTPNLVELARRAPHAESARRDAQSFAVFETRLEARTRRPMVRGAALALALAAVAVVFLWQRDELPERPLTYQVTREPQLAARDTHESPVSLLSFSDGSTVSLGRQTTAHVASTTSHGAHVQLRRGSAAVSVVPRRGNAWDVEAGPYRVHVTGTAFTVSWDPERQHFELRMQHGSVEVKGPLAGRGVALHAGQQLSSSLPEQRLVVDRLTEPSAAADTLEAPSSARAPVEEDAAAPDSDGKALAAKRAPARAGGVRPQRAGQSDFAQLVMDGRFDDVVREAYRMGISRVLESAPLDELAALADAARYTRENELARRALLGLQRRFPGSSSGRSAAFFLARVSQGEETLRWYEHYLTHEPKGAYASEALGHAMTLYAERGDLVRARKAARRYLALKSSGPYAGSARRILEDGSSQGR